MQLNSSPFIFAKFAFQGPTGAFIANVFFLHLTFAIDCMLNVHQLLCNRLPCQFTLKFDNLQTSETNDSALHTHTELWIKCQKCDFWCPYSIACELCSHQLCVHLNRFLWLNFTRYLVVHSFVFFPLSGTVSFIRDPFLLLFSASFLLLVRFFHPSHSNLLFSHCNCNFSLAVSQSPMREFGSMFGVFFLMNCPLAFVRYCLYCFFHRRSGATWI